MDNLLSITTFIPAIAAAILVIFLRGEDASARQSAKWVALIATILTFLVSIFILAGFDPNDTGFQFVEEAEWLLGLKYKMGVDGISVLFVMLTTFIMPLTIAASWNVDTRVKEYMVAFLLLETLMLGVFMSLDLVLFYLFFEAGLIPMFLIIGIWGGSDRIYASFKFFLYTFLGSVLMLVAMVAMFAEAGTTDIPVLMTHGFWQRELQHIGRACRWRHADIDVYRVLCQFCRENANVACTYLASGCACSGTDSRFGCSCGDSFEDGRIWLFKVQSSHVSGWQ